VVLKEVFCWVFCSLCQCTALVPAHTCSSYRPGVGGTRKPCLVFFFSFSDVFVKDWACRQAGCSSGHPAPWGRAAPTCGADWPWAGSVAWGHVEISAKEVLGQVLFVLSS